MKNLIQNEYLEINEEIDNYRLSNDENYRKEWIDKMLEKNAISYKFPERKFYLACFDALRDEIYFQDYFTDEIIRKTCLLNRHIENYQKRKNILRSYWQKIVKLTGFNQWSYISQRTKEYLKRPIYSDFICPETKGIFTNHYHNFIPSVIKNYQECEVEITAHLNCFDDELIEYTNNENKDNNEENIDDKTRNNIFNKTYDEFKYSCKIPMLYVVNSLIQDTIDELKIFLLSKMKEEKNKIKVDEENNDMDLINEEYNNINHLKGNYKNFKNGISLNQNQDTGKKNTLSSEYLFYKKQFSIIKQNEKNKEYQFVFKTAKFEEYIFGNNPIGSYESIYTAIRQYKKVQLIICKLPKYMVEPKLTSFPPIITMEENEEITYFKLLDKYFDLFQDEYAIFRYGETDINNSREKDREGKLLNYCESSNCNCPFEFDVVGVFNFKLIFEWLNDNNYNKNEIMLEYFSEFPTKEEYENSLFKNRVKKFFHIKDKENNSNSNTHYHKTGIIEQGNIINDTTIVNEEVNVKKKSSAEKKEEEKDLKKELKEKRNAKKLLRKSRKNETILQEKLNYLKVNPGGEDNKVGLLGNLLNSTSFPDAVERKINELNVNPFYPLPHQKNMNYKYLNFNPIFIQLKIELLYGSYDIQTLFTQNYLINDNVYMMEVMTFDTKKLLINNLPKESRLGITVFVINKDSSLKVELGSGQIAIFNEKDEMLSGDIKINLWPLFQINPRVNCCDEFLVKSQIIKHKTASTKSYVKEKLKNLKGDKRYRNKERNKYFNNIKSPYKKVLKKATFFSQTSYKTNDKLNYNSYEISSGDNLFINKGDYNKNEFCYIILKFPKFSSPMRYTEKNQFSEEDFKELKDAKSGGKNQLKDLFMFNKFNETINEFKETVPINDEYIANNNPNIESIKENIKNEKDKLSELNIENLFEKLKKINKLISLDPLSPIKDDEDRKDILICRDFLCTDPKALDIFLRAINWFNPLERYLAHLYLNRWAELEPEDALGLLDARFPDTQVRLLAIKTLSKATDDFIDLYMLELCQCLFYENHYISPLSDFLIGRCLKNKKLLGNKFYWCLKVAAENYLFKDKITTLLTQLFMMSGPFFIDNITNIININAEFKNLSKTAKKYYPKEGSEVSKRIRQLVKERFNNGVCKFELPIHPSYCAFGFEFTKLRVFSSKMVPIALNLYSSEGKTFRVIFKIGDDLRQDLMILQIFRIMDKIWMENDLDLKFTLYNVCPIELKCGFMEFAEGSPVEEIQKNMNGGDILQDTLYLYLQNLSYEITQNPNHLQFKKMLDNYIKSLAGYCVATGVLGIADRHPANVMLNFNGLFFHIDFGHIFGNFKTKFGFKRERSVFLLTPQMAYIYIQSNNNKEFIHYCTSAFNILRANAKRIINIMITMSSSNMPEFSTMSDLSYVRTQLKLFMNEKEASEYLIKTIKDSLNDKYRTFDNLIHNFVHP